MSHWWQNTASHDYTLTVAGRDIIDYVPLDLSPIRFEESGSNAVGRMTFYVEDPDLALGWPSRPEVQLVDNVTDRYLFGGIVLRRRLVPMPGGGRITECECVSWDWYLDRNMVIRWGSFVNRNGRRRRLTTDRRMVQSLIRKQARFLIARNATVDATNTDMDVVRVAGVSVREALERIADEAAPGDGETASNAVNRRFYVDYERQLHYFKAPLGNAAPYRIADGSYIGDVLADSPTEYWSLREEAGSVAYGSQGANLTWQTTPTRGVTSVGAVNEPHYRAVTVDGDDYATGTVTTPGDTFSFECWFKRGDSGVLQHLFHTNANGDFRVTITAGDKIELYKHGSASSFTTTPTYTDTDWHHLVFAHDAASTLCYVDGASVAGSGSNQTFSGASRTVSILGTSGGANCYTGSAQHIAVYPSKLSAAQALAHYNQGISLTPETLEYEIDDEPVVDAVYIRGKRGKPRGSGWGWQGSPNPDAHTEAILNRPRSNTRAKRNRAARSFLRRNRRVTGGSFRTDLTGWRAGQLLYVTDASLGLDGDQFEVASVRGELQAGNAVEYEIEFGVLGWRLTRELRRRKSPYERGT